MTKTAIFVLVAAASGNGTAGVASGLAGVPTRGAAGPRQPPRLQDRVVGTTRETSTPAVDAASVIRPRSSGLASISRRRTLSRVRGAGPVSAHAAVTDVEGKRHVSAERLNRAGAEPPAPPRASLRSERRLGSAVGVTGRHKVHARESNFAFDLTLTEDRPAVLNGVRGYSQKGATPGNASGALLADRACRPTGRSPSR